MPSMQQMFANVIERLESIERKVWELESDQAADKEAILKELGTLSRKVGSPTGIDVPSTPRPRSLKRLGVGADH